MNSLWASTDIQTLKNLAMGLSGASIIIGLVLMKVVSSIVGKIISLIVFIAIALAGYSQRAQVIDCANSVKAQATATAAIDTTCTFFGQEIKVSVPQPSQ
jgi:hypothetical protein